MLDSQLKEMANSDEMMRQLIGRTIGYLDQHYEVIDILFDEDMMILATDDHSDLQDDCYGRAHRRVPKRCELRFRNAEGEPTHIWDEITLLKKF
ncbi:MAG: hypothetical protein R8M38_04465 [Mariprofundaceae bacterium]